MPQQSGKKFKEAKADIGFDLVGTDLPWQTEIVNPDLGDALTVTFNQTY